MQYREMERTRLVALRGELFNDPGDGPFYGKDRNFVLHDPSLNLWEGIRKDVIEYFTSNDIKWWESKDGPTGHLLSSHIACLNHLFRPDSTEISQRLC